MVGIGGLILGVILMFASRPFFTEYFRPRPEVADPAVLEKPGDRSDPEEVSLPSGR